VISWPIPLSSLFSGTPNFIRNQQSKIRRCRLTMVSGDGSQLGHMVGAKIEARRN
jgi:hypothetical protein